MSESLTLGVLGGMGPAATVDFLAKLQALTPAESDQDHIHVLCDLNPHVPDRNVAGSGAGLVLAGMAEGLRVAGAEVLAIACNTAHAHADMIQHASGLPLVDMIETAASAARAAGSHRVGVLGTKGALKLYREYLAAQAMGMVTLDGGRQEMFMETVYRIKGGDLGPAVRREMTGFAADLIGGGAEVLIAGCTEIALVMSAADVAVPMIDPSEQLARRCVAVCLGLEATPQVVG